MSVLKLIFGFVVGLVACAILLGLISIRSPILANSETLATQKVIASSNVIDDSGEQKVNIELADVDETSDPEKVPVTIIDDTSDAVAPEVLDEKIAEGAKPIQEEPEPIAPTVVEQVPATVLKRAGNVLNLGSGSSRLPSVSEVNEDADVVENAPDDALSIFETNSNAIVELDTPFLSIILVDIGSAGVSQADLLRQTLPLAFAVDGSRSDAARVAGDYRAAGFEVVTLLNAAEVEALKTADEAASAVQAYLAAVPMALAIVDAPSAKLQKNSRLFAPTIASLAKDSPGFLTYKGGLNTSAKVIKEANLPTGAITRFLDETYGSPSVIKRAIDRTTIEAAKNGAAILMAVATPAVLQGIAQWADSSAAAKVEMVSVSSSMKRQKP